MQLQNDESMPCSPCCELLGADGYMADYHKCLEAGCDAVMLEELQIDRDTVTRWQRLLDLSEVDFDKEGIDQDCTLEVWSVEFDNGCVADLKLCSGDTSLFLDPVLFRPLNGGLIEELVLDCPDNILGDHVFANYVMRVTLKTE
ncbi:MAG: hypothetical protein FWE06_04000 [Oscillospiraceae bacterium]|nr:hypothetical protein [Oscillospiraceae bacterium]